MIAELEETEKPDIILATTHLGHYEDGHNGSNAPDDVALARSLEPGTLDAIIGGHSQNPVCMEPGTNNYREFNPGESCTPDQQNGTYIMQAHEWGKYVGRADFEVTDGVVKLANYELIPVNLKVKDENGDKVFVGEELQKDQDLYTLLKYYQDKGDAALGDLIAHLNGKLEGERDIVRSQQTNLGRLIATAATEVVPGASFGIMNSGGVRASINLDNANNFEVTYRHVLEVQPFGNTVTRVEMNGKEIQAYLGVVATKQVGSGAYAQFSGLNMNVDCQADQVTIHTIGGVAFDPQAEYVFTVPSYNAAGGDSYPAVNYVDTGFVDADVLKAYFETKGTINATDYNFQGEIVYENSEVTTGCQVTL